MNKKYASRKWSPHEWEVMREKLEELSEDQLAELVVNMGIQFEGGVGAVIDKSHMSRKEQLILVLDESDRAELEKAVSKFLE